MRKVVLFGPSIGLKPGRGRSSVAPFHRAVERLRDDPRADTGQLAAVQLRLAEDVEPERRVGQERALAVPG